MPQLLSNLPTGATGAKVKFGSLHGVPIVWKLGDKNHSGYPANSVTLVSDRIIKIMCFDAREQTNGDENRQVQGNNRYIYSNIRQWLNSVAAAGAWYTAQHAADAPPSSSTVYSGWNAYDTIAGFLNAFSAKERTALLDTTHVVGRSSIDGGGTESCIDKVFLLSCTEVGITGDVAAGVKLAMFSDNASRIATVTPECSANSNYPSNPASGVAWFWWLADAYAATSNKSRFVSSDGSHTFDGSFAGHRAIRPACNLSGDLLVSDAVDADGCYTVIYNTAPTVPASITVPTEINGGTSVDVSWGLSTDVDGNLSGYILEQSVDGGAWTAIYTGPLRAYSAPITFGWGTIQFRVKAYDTAGTSSGYTTGPVRTVVNNTPPAISGADGDLGSFVAAAPSYDYTVSDAEGDVVTVVEKLDGVTLRTYAATLGVANTLTLTADAWLKILNGPHTLTITATDTEDASVTRTQTFTKAVTSVALEQTLAMAADAMPTKAIVNIQGSFPAGSVLTIEICNNGNDAAPTWEDVTDKALNSQKHFFTNTSKTDANWGVKVRVSLLRGTAAEICYIQSIGGNFE